jgi:hypothetical protein
MKRLLVLVAVLVPLSLFVAGCGGAGASPDKAGGQFTEAKKQEMKEMMMKSKAKMETEQPGGMQGKLPVK